MINGGIVWGFVGVGINLNGIKSICSYNSISIVTGWDLILLGANIIQLQLLNP